MTVGAGNVVYVKMSAPDVADVPVALVTVTSTVPAACAGEVAVIDVAPFTVTVAELAPNFTVEPAVKLVPVTVTEVPPAGTPEVGLIDVTVGAGNVV